MKTNFDWQTDADDSFEPCDSTGEPLTEKRSGCLVAALVISLILIGSLFWLLNRRQNTVIARLREDVTLAFDVQQQALQTQDQELFSSMLSASDRAWKDDQERLFSADLVSSQILWGAAKDFEPGVPSSFIFSPDLTEVELTYPQSIITVSDSGEETTLQLLHTLVYRLENGRWLNAPQDLSFWGSWETIDKPTLSLATPARDMDVAQRLADTIESHLSRLCPFVEADNSYAVAVCAGDIPWRIRLSTDPGTMLELAQYSPRSSAEFDYELPAPSLVGIPAKESDYDTYLAVYADSLLRRMESDLLTVVPYPDQTIYALCFDHPISGRHLYHFDHRTRSWQTITPRQVYAHLSALPDDSAIMFGGGGHLLLIDLSDNLPLGGGELIWHRTFQFDGSYTHDGWVTVGDEVYHVLLEVASDGASRSYSAVNLQECGDTTCKPMTLAGFPYASPNSEKVLYAAGSDISVGLQMGGSAQSMGTGFSPFLINDELFGYVRFSDDSDTGITTQLVLSQLRGDEVQVLLDSHDLIRAAALPEESGLYVSDVILNPANPKQLLLAAAGVRDFSGRYFIFSVDIDDWLDQPIQAAIELELTREGTLGGVPGSLTPTGPLPFLVSADGRWLAMTELNGQESDAWSILIHDLYTGTTTLGDDSVPAMPGNFPLFDWSSDGQWLFVGDRKYLQLFAPELGYHERIAHDFDACSHMVWGG